MTEESASASNRSLSARLSKVERAVLDPERVVKLERATEGHERNASDLSRAFTEFSAGLSERVKALEVDRQERRIAEAAANVEDKQLKQDVHKIKVFIESMQDNNIVGKVKDMSGGFRQLFWLVIGAVVMGGVGIIFLAMRGAL